MQTCTSNSLPLLTSPTVHNFSHRIDCLSFGNEVPGHINPLDGTEKITLERRLRFNSSLKCPNNLSNAVHSNTTHKAFTVIRSLRVCMQTNGNAFKWKCTQTEDHSQLWITLDLMNICGLILFSDNQNFQYFITVVPTKLHTSDVSVDMHQFSVTERVCYLCALVHLFVCAADSDFALSCRTGL